MQRLLTLIIAAAIIYMLFLYNTKNMQWPGNSSDNQSENKKEQQNTTLDTNQDIVTSQPSGSFLEKTLSKVLINILNTAQGRAFFENILQPMESKISGEDVGSYKINNTQILDAIFQINTEGEGQKGPASCGHVVKVKYSLMTTDNHIIENKIETITLGNRKVMLGLNAVIVGMKTGQTRHALIPAKYLNDDLNIKNKNAVKLSVYLEDIIPHNFAVDDVKIFDDEIAYFEPLMCGNYVYYDAKVTKLSSGKVIYDSKENGKRIAMQIGDLRYPIIVSHALHNKIPAGTRTVIAKGKLFQSFIDTNSVLFPTKPLSPNEYFMLEIYNFNKDH